jgi:hypothetical protein
MLRSVFVGLFVALSCYPALSAQPPAHVWELQEIAAALGLPEPALGNQWEDAPCSLVYRCGSHACFS